jgi:hypothetical protein
MTPILVFDIETVPDIAGLRRLHDIDASLSDAAVTDWAMQQRRAATGRDFLPLHLQRVVAIGCALRDASGLRVWSLGELADPEPELIRRFFDGIERYTPQLVSWNGSGFDLPVLHHRSLIHGVARPSTGNGRRRPRLPVQQLSRSLSHAASRPDGRACGYQHAVGAGSTRWRGCAVFRASSAWTAAKSPRPWRPGSWTPCGAIAKPT